MWREYVVDVILAGKLARKHENKVCILLCLFRLNHGLRYLWILFSDCLELGKDMILSLWLWIDFLRWLISSLVTKLMMHHLLLNYSLEKLLGCTVCLEPL